MTRLKSIIKKIAVFFLILLLSLTGFWLLNSEVTNNADEYVYNLPFKEGSSHTVIQGYGGWFSHKEIAALDFYMPVGTPVYAARAGIVYSYKEDSEKGGPLPGYKKQANYIIIKHADGSFGCYWHLKHKGVVTKSGTVQKGQLVGYSGSTGFVLSPHLHFSVKNTLNYKKDSFVKTKFNTTKGVLLLKRGETYERPL
jgi:murein DD-endopeptidase MepM/ murein hydrolase activator NlpD